MRTKTQKVRIYLRREERSAVEARAAASGLTLSALLRETALRPPRWVPTRCRIVGLGAMDEAGSTLGHALRNEDGRTPAEAPVLAQQLHACIMALTVEAVTAVPSLPAGRIGNGGTRRPLPPEERVRPLEIRLSVTEDDAMRRLAAVYGMALSEYVRRRVLGQPMQMAKPALEGLGLVRKCTSLLGHAAAMGMAPGADQLCKEALEKCSWLRRQGRTAA